MNAGDFDRWLNLWDEDGRQYFPDAPPRMGKDEIATGMQPLIDTLVIEEFAINTNEVHVFDDQAYAHGLYGFSGKPKGGCDTVKFSGKFLTIFKKQADGSWRILIDCFNYNGMGE